MDTNQNNLNTPLNSNLLGDSPIPNLLNDSADSSPDYPNNPNLPSNPNYHSRILFIIAVVFVITAVSASAVYYFKKPNRPTVAIQQEIKKPKLEEPKEIAIASFDAAQDLKKPKGRLSSFSDTFSGTGWKDAAKSNVRQDDLTTILSLPLKYELASSSLPQNASSTKATATSTDPTVKCLQNKCLALKDQKIYLDNKKVSLDFPVTAIEKLSNYWILASDHPQSPAYRPGRLLVKGGRRLDFYLFDGSEAKKLVGQEFFKSDYEGEIIMGGTDEDFIAGFYGYGSKFLRFKKDKDCETKLNSSNFEVDGGVAVINHLPFCYTADDISFWFGARLAKIKNIRMMRNPDLDGEIIFYSEDDPFLMVAPSNFPIDLTDELKLKNYTKIKVEDTNNLPSSYKEELGGGLVISALGKDNQWDYFRLVDQGFGASANATWVSSAISPQAPQSAAILEYFGKDNGGKINFYFSIDDAKTWIPAPLGETIYFSDRTNAKNLRWKMDLIGSNDPSQSPFVDLVRMSYGI